MCIWLGAKGSVNGDGGSIVVAIEDVTVVDVTRATTDFLVVFDQLRWMQRATSIEVAE